MTGIHQLLMSNFSISEAGAAGIIATGGNEVKTVGDFKYHIFTGNGTFNVSAGGTINVFSIGGGGGGGADAAGGGGAGEVDLANEFTVSAETAYSIVIGAGGAGMINADGTTASPASATDGSDTTFSSGGTNLLVTLGGGVGKGNNSTTVGAGGSGGGSNYTGTGGGAANGDNTNVGGNGGGSYFGGGGGGATQAGQDGPQGTTAGKGGEGLALSATDSLLTFANFDSFTEANFGIVASGGGGAANGGSVSGGQGGTGGGNGGKGSGGTVQVECSGGASFGSGGGASGASHNNAGKGAPGLFIIRYAA